MRTPPGFLTWLALFALSSWAVGTQWHTLGVVGLLGWFVAGAVAFDLARPQAR